jgi:hypothetical protein
MSTLTFEQRAARDSFVVRILSAVTHRIGCNDEVQPRDIEYWEYTAKDLGLSEKAISQTVEEVRQVLNLMSKLNKKRVA